MSCTSTYKVVASIKIGFGTKIFNKKSISSIDKLIEQLPITIIMHIDPTTVHCLKKKNYHENRNEEVL